MQPLPPIFSSDSVHDRRYVGLWIALTGSAGAVNALALAACQRFVTHVTGTVTRVGADVGQPRLLFEYACVLLCFVLGAMTSGFMLDGRRVQHRRPWPSAPIFLVALVLAATAVCGMLGCFGPFGSTVETAGDFVMLSVLAFAMGLQNASVATTTGMIVRTTHMTGPVTDFSIALAMLLSSAPEASRQAALRSVKLRGAKILAFVFGAFLGTVLAPVMTYAGFLVPAAVTAGAAIALRVIMQRRDDVAVALDAASARVASPT